MLPKQFMAVSILSSLIATFFAAISIISVDENNNVLQDLSWGKGHNRISGVNEDIYVGVFQVGYQQSNSNGVVSVKQKYDAGNCTATYCRTCHHYMPIVIGFLAAFILMSIFSVYTNFARFHDTGNTSKNKVIGALTSLASIALGLVSLIVFSTTCLQKVKDYVHDSISTNYDWHFGSSYSLLVASVCLKFIDMLFNVWVDVNERLATPKYAATANNDVSAPPTKAKVHEQSITQADKV